MLRRALLVLLLGAVAALAAVGSARADQEFFLVVGTADGGGTCTPYPSVPGGFTCPTLRSAVAAADANPGQDVVFLANAGTYRLASAIDLTTDVEIAGGNAQTTTIQGPAADQILVVSAGVNAVVYGVTLSGADAGDGDGGAIRNLGTASLAFVRVTGSVAARGGGVANSGSMLISNSLIDGNSTTTSPSQGGGIYNAGTLEVFDSTITGNQAITGAGIYSEQGASLDLIQTTVARNASGGGIGGVAANGAWQSSGSLFVGNTNDGPAIINCDGPPTPASANLEDNGSCGVTASTGIALDAALSFQGGQTPVLAFPASSTVKRFVTACPTNIDQRQAPRTAGGACDAGAYQEGATAPPVQPFAIPTVTPSPTPAPTATPVVTPTPTPVPRKSVVGQVVKGTVKIKLPGSNTFIVLDGTQSIPVGATVDTRHGTVRLTALQKPGGKLETATFFDGLFKLTQTRTTTDLTLNEPLAPCSKRHAARAAAKKPKSRKLWGSGHGSFRTRGTYSAATVRGTKWLVQDSCAGTLTRVAQGVVSVRDNVRRKTIILRAGKKYLARPRR